MSEAKSRNPVEWNGILDPEHIEAGAPPPLLRTGIRIYSWRYQILKRWLDLVGASIILAVVAVPGLLIAAAILLTSPGPIFYRETRIGRSGRPFRIWKFRTMANKMVWKEVPLHGQVPELRRWQSSVVAKNDLRPSLVGVVTDSFFDGITGAALFGKVRRT
jgi:lipopolysaccharide/colanic/teichoic acid biosynthesis glycosyltransferase